MERKWEMNIKEITLSPILEKYCKNYQVEVSKDFFAIYTNDGNHVVTFNTKDIINILKVKKII